MGTFQVILYEGSNNIRIQYRDLMGSTRALGDSATIGIKKDNTTYEQYSTNSASLAQGQPILYTPNGSSDYTVASTTPGSGQEVGSGYDLVYLAPEGAPASPTLVNPPNATTGITTTPTFEWLPIDGATSYTVLISTVSNFSSTVVNASGQTGTSYTLGSALNENTTYYWRIQAVNSKGSSLSSTRSFTTSVANTVPNAPDNVSSATLIGGGSLSSLSGASLSLSLSDPDDSEQVRYRLQIATDDSFNNLIIDYRSPFGSEGEASYSYGASTGTYLVGSSSTVLSPDDYYLRLRAEDDAAASSSWYTISGAAFTVLADTTAPTITEITASSISTNSATISWTTNEAASSLVEYGLVSAYGFLTAEVNTTPRVTSHSLNLSNLKPCARYFYRVKSKDSDNNQSTSSNQNFTTTGCLVSSVTRGAENSVATSGGSVSLSATQLTAELTIPSSYATESASFQINQLDTATLPAPPPDRTNTGHVFDLLAVTDSNIQLTSFSTPITFTITYDQDVESSYNESTLDVYRYSGSEWEKKNCVLDTTANTLTCSLSSFSVYGVFGQTNPASSGSSDSNQKTSSTPTSTCDPSPLTTIPDLFQINTTRTTATLYFTPLSETSRYIISYSTLPHAEEHGADVVLGQNGVQHFTVELLSPNQTYYFKVRGQNNCRVGDWSRILAADTLEQHIVYAYAPPSPTRTLLKSQPSSPPKPTQLVTSGPTPDLSPTPTPSSNDTASSSPSPWYSDLKDWFASLLGN